MANDNRPVGLYPLRPAGHSTIPVSVYQMNTGTDLFLYSPVAIAADGLVAAAIVGTAASVAYLGSIVGFLDENKASIQELDPWFDASDATAARYAIVADDPNQEFLVQEDTGGAALTQAEVGTVFSMLYLATSGNTTTGIASLELDRSTTVTTTAGQVQLLRLHDALNSDGTANAVGNWGKWVVRILKHQRGGQDVTLSVV